MRQILLVQQQLDLAMTLEAELTTAFEAFEETPKITMSFNEQNARTHLPGDYDLVIVAMDIRRTARDPLLPDAGLGLELVQWMNSSGMNKAFILIATVITEEIRAAQSQQKNSCIVLTGVNMVQEVVNRSKELVVSAPSKCLDVEIQLLSKTEWKYKMTGSGFSFEDSDTIVVDSDTLQELEEDSRIVLDTSERNLLLRRIGKKLIGALEKKFYGSVMAGMVWAGDEKNTRVRFVVTPDMHNITLEAVLCPRSETHWALQAPVYRRLSTGQPSTNGFLFQGGARLDCLLVDAPTSGMVGDILLPALNYTTAECDWLQSFLERQKQTTNIGLIKRLPDPASTKPLSEQLSEALTRRWGILHFAGHSYSDDTLTKGYLFLPGPAGGVVKLESARFGDQLRTVTFIYLSSCNSGAGPFVFALASRRVPNILGFRWPINDQWAFEHTQKFYTNLFKEKSLEQAYLKARQEMHTDDDSSWAAPILIKQIGEV